MREAEAAYDDLESELDGERAREDLEVGVASQRSSQSSFAFLAEAERHNWIASSARMVWLFLSRRGTGAGPRDQDLDGDRETRRQLRSGLTGSGTREGRGGGAASLLFRGVEMQLLEHMPARSLSPSEELYV